MRPFDRANPPLASLDQPGMVDVAAVFLCKGRPRYDELRFSRDGRRKNIVYDEQLQPLEFRSFHLIDPGVGIIRGKIYAVQFARVDLSDESFPVEHRFFEVTNDLFDTAAIRAAFGPN